VTPTAQVSSSVMTLPLSPPIAPMEALSVGAIPVGADWQYEPKWDGFRCILFRDAGHVEIQSKSGKPLTRYFPPGDPNVAPGVSAL
jgi:ATP-dependent DNA ligase